MERWIILLSSIAALVSCERLNLSKYPCYQPPSQQLNYRNARIVGGHDAKREQTPYFAALTRSGGNVFCGSSIVSERFLIVAAHCLCTNQNKIMKPTQMRVYVGINSVSDIKRAESGNDVDVDDEPHEVVVDKMIVHEDYMCGRKMDSDIGAFSMVDTQQCFILSKSFQHCCN
jgi:secreted trypsin-like serine protease